MALAIEIGERYGRLVVVGPPDYRDYHHFYPVLCDCGTSKVVRRDGLATGSVSSCGCLQREVARQVGRSTTHGSARRNHKSRAYIAWQNLRQRCLNTNHRDYPHYGGRGITVCDRWETFANFLADMGEPAAGLTLDRINNDAGYFPDNCRWATWAVQRRNQRKKVSVPVSVEGPLGCHIWRGATTPRGYPVMRYNGKTRVARRVFYEEAKGPVPEGHRVVMDCGERACVNADHMVAKPQ